MVEPGDGRKETMQEERTKRTRGGEEEQVHGRASHTQLPSSSPCSGGALRDNVASIALPCLQVQCPPGPAGRRLPPILPLV